MKFLSDFQLRRFWVRSQPQQQSVAARSDISNPAFILGAMPELLALFRGMMLCTGKLCALCFFSLAGGNAVLAGAVAPTKASAVSAILSRELKGWQLTIVATSGFL
jgi:hypothetical protein